MEDQDLLAPTGEPGTVPQAGAKNDALANANINTMDVGGFDDSHLRFLKYAATRTTLRRESGQAWRLYAFDDARTNQPFSGPAANSSLSALWAASPDWQPSSTRPAPFQVTERFEGRVLEVTAEGFVATVQSTKSNRTGHAIVEFSKDDVDPHDRPAVGPDAIFYWVLGYSTHIRRRKESFLTFSGTRRPSQHAIHDAEAFFRSAFSPED